MNVMELTALGIFPEGRVRMVNCAKPASVVEPPKGPPTAISAGQAEIYAILGERYSSGHTDTAERHNEHQP